MKKLQSLWVALLLVSTGAGAPGAETVPLEDGGKAQKSASTASVLYFPDYVDGGGWSVQLVLNNVDPSQSAPVEVEVYDQQGRPVPGFFGSGNSFEIPPRGSRVLRSAGAGNLRRGWIEVGRQTASVHGLLTYRHGESGIEVGVRPVPLNDHFALYVEESSEIGTGLAIFKPDGASEIEFRLRDEAGFDPLGRVLTQRNFQQRADVLPDWFTGVGTGFLENFRGLLFLRSADGSGFAPMGLRGGRGSLSAVPLIPISGDGGGSRPPNPFQPDDAPGGGGTLYFPDFVDGGGWSVQLVLNNIDLTRSAPVEVAVYDQQGRTVPVFFDSVSRFEIPAGGSRVLRSPGGGSVQRGWIEVETESASVHGLLTYRHAESGIEVGVEPVALSDHFALYVEESSDIGTGLAIFKPDAASEIEFQFRDEAGLDPLGEVLAQGNFQQRAHVLPDWLQGVDTGFLEDFRGLLFLRAADGSEFAPMGLRGGKRQGSLSAVPLIPIMSDGAGKIYWTVPGDSPPPGEPAGRAGKIQRANLDGSRVEDLVTELPNPRGIALDLGARKMYWTDSETGKIQRANLDGSGVEDLVTGLSFPTGIALDLGAGMMYWTDPWRDRIQRANLDGTRVEYLVGGPVPGEIALDLVAGKMYWTDSYSVSTDYRIRRANLDGSGVEDLVTGLGFPNGIALDLVAGKMYWTDSYSVSTLDYRIRRANLDGSRVEDLVTGLEFARGIALDLGSGKMYWARGDRIKRANLDGTGIEDVVTGLPGSARIALDLGVDPGTPPPGGLPPDLAVVSLSVSDDTLTAGQSFELRAEVRNQGGNPSNATTLRYYLSTDPTISTRDSEVGTDVVGALASAGASAESIELAAPTSAGTYYYGACVDALVREISTRNNCSDGVQVTVSGGGSSDGARKMYWTDGGTYKIQRANLDGSRVEDLVTGLGNPESIALDPGGGKMYWTDAETDKIQRANLDRSGVEDLVTGLDNPVGIALDLGGGKMYWTDARTYKIQRANLDGTEVEDLVTTGLRSPVGIALDLGAGKVYWTDWLRDKIQRANLDGSGLEDVVRVGGNPLGIALDAGAGKMYWVDDGGVSEGKIRRANLDGTEVEDLVTGLSYPNGIALALGGGGGDDHANDRSGATPLALNSSLAGEIETSEDEDWFRVETGGRRHLRVRTTGSLDTVGTLFDASGRQLVTDDDGGSGTNFALEEEVPAGVYYVRVQGFGSNTGTYTVEEHGEPAGDDHANDRSGSTPLALNSSLAGEIEISGDEDWFRVETGGRRHLRVRTTGSLDTFGTLFDASGQQLASDDDSGSGLNFALEEEVPAGVYYVRVEGFGSSDTGTYTVEEHGEPVGGGSTPRTPKIYWTDSGTNKIQRANLDGTGVEDLVTGLRAPSGLALDKSAGKIYWTDSRDGKIQRANLDGTGSEDLVTGLDTPGWVALDPGAGKIYWTDWRRDKIQRANLDGTGIEDLITGLNRPRDVALDPGAGKIYWAESYGRQIQRANLDGSGVEDLVTGLDDPFGLALDVGTGKIYWSDWATPKIQHANLDGTGVEDLITGLNSPRDITLDPGSGKIYWAELTPGKIQRANLDGSGVEDLVSGLNRPIGIALDLGN